MKRKILVLGATQPDGLLIQKMKEEFGEELEFYTPEEAQLKGIKPEEFANIPTYKIEALPKHTEPIILRGDYATGEKVGKGGRARNRSTFRKGKNFR